jgi:hypothetical protein
MSNISVAEQAEKKPLTFSDLRTMLGKDNSTTKIVQYDSLDKFQNMNDAMQGSKSLIILLSIETKNAPPVGHFICILSYPDHFEHFDSYGIGIDKELAITHEKPLLSRLLKASGKRFITNRVRLQQVKAHVNTCGRWCVVRTRHYQMDMKEFVNWIKGIHYKPDLAVTMLTLHSGK